MKKIIISLLLLSFCFIIKVKSQTIENKFTIEEKIFALSKIWKEVGENYPYFDRFPPKYWDSLYTSNISCVVGSTNDFEFYKVIESFVNSLYEGHTSISLPIEYQKYIYKDLGRLNIFATWLNDGFYVEYGYEDNTCKIMPGDKILKINDIEVLEYAKTHLRKYTNAFFDHVLKYQYGNFLFVGEINTKIKIKYQNLKGEINEKEMLRIKKPQGDLNFINKNFYIYNQNKNKLEFYINKDKIAYLNLGGNMSNNTVDYFKTKIDSIRTCNGLIIDLRFSEGGSSVGNLIVNYFSKKDEYSHFKALVRKNQANYKALGAYTDSTFLNIFGGNLRHFEYKDYYENNAFDTVVFYSKKEKKSINIPVVALCNPSVISATETFLISFQNAKAGLIIGQPSYGSCTQPYLVPLKNIGYFQVATQKPIYSDGTVFDYIHPDIVVNPTLKGYKEGRDEILEAGYNYFKKLK